MKNITFISVVLALIAVLISGRAFILQVSPDKEIIQYNTTETTQPIVETVETPEVTKVTEQVEFIYEEPVSTTFVEEVIEETEVVNPTEEPKETQKSVEQVNSLYADDYNYSNFYGRLYIQSVGIDVALYYELSQSATDRVDSAAIFTYGSYDGEIIADHNNQDFGKLFDVVVGTTGYIQLSNGDVINIKCVDVLNGHNTGTELTDENYCSVMGQYDYLMYTCRNGWQNIRICQWNCY